MIAMAAGHPLPLMVGAIRRGVVGTAPSASLA